MTGSSRSTRWALMAYGLLSVLMLSGVTWGTVATLRLQGAEAEMIRENDFRDAKNRVLARMDNLIMPVLAREANRAYWEYDPYSHPHMYQLDGTKVISDAYIQPSPLIDQEPEPWIKLHFQVDAYGEWQSPQVPTADRFGPGATIASVNPTSGVERLALLDRLRASYTFEELQLLIDESGGWEAGMRRDVEQPTRCIASICEKWFERDRWLRSERNQKLLTSSLPQRVCEHSNVALSNLFDRSIYDADEGPGIPITVSSMKPLWLDVAGEESPMLGFCRVVSTDVPGLESIQGFLIDWGALRETLLAKDVIDDLASVVVDLEPLAMGDRAPADRTMTTLPAVIVGHPAVAETPPWTSTHWLLVATWAAALAVLAVVGFGIQSLLTLADRRSQFAYAVTHQLRTPLTTLRLYTDMLASGIVRPEDRQRYVETLSTESERLSDLVDEVLEHARVENHKVTLDIQVATVAELLETIREHCHDRCQKAGKSLVIDVNGLAGEKVETDPNLLRQIVTNLIDNACKHSAGADDPTITLSASRQHADRVSLEVADRGPGVAAHQRHLIFKPFRRVRDAEHRNSAGIGLGLALAKSWSGLIGARLELVHADTPGATFRLTLPRRV